MGSSRHFRLFLVGPLCPCCQCLVDDNNEEGGGTEEDVGYVPVSGDIVHCSIAFHLENHVDGVMSRDWDGGGGEKVFGVLVGLE